MFSGWQQFQDPKLMAYIFAKNLFSEKITSYSNVGGLSAMTFSTRSILSLGKVYIFENQRKSMHFHAQINPFEAEDLLIIRKHHSYSGLTVESSSPSKSTC
jgi:hypothetical protein